MKVVEASLLTLEPSKVEAAFPVRLDGLVVVAAVEGEVDGVEEALHGI
ncbi:MAG: hypothetical protein V4731_05795 [Pseudomonadota bacterium]